MPIRPVLQQAARRATAPFRALPSLLIIGCMRCGTSSLYQWMVDHPEVTTPLQKEIHFFNHHYGRGVSWYRAFFPLGGGGVFTLDGTPAYLSHPLAAERAAAVVSEAKIIASLRDPVDRAWSHYRFRKGRGYEDRTFAQALEDDLTTSEASTGPQLSPNRTASYLSAGRYGDQLPAWLDAFGEDRILLIDADALFAGDQDALCEIEDFLGFSHSGLPLQPLNSAPTADIAPTDRVMLTDYYADSNARLAELTDRPFRWLER